MLYPPLRRPLARYVDLKIAFFFPKTPKRVFGSRIPVVFQRDTEKYSFRKHPYCASLLRQFSSDTQNGGNPSEALLGIFGQEYLIFGQEYFLGLTDVGPVCVSERERAERCA